MEPFKNQSQRRRCHLVRKKIFKYSQDQILLSMKSWRRVHMSKGTNCKLQSRHSFRRTTCVHARRGQPSHNHTMHRWIREEARPPQNNWGITGNSASTHPEPAALPPPPSPWKPAMVLAVACRRHPGNGRRVVELKDTIKNAPE